MTRKHNPFFVAYYLMRLHEEAMKEEVFLKDSEIFQFGYLVEMILEGRDLNCIDVDDSEKSIVLRMQEKVTTLPMRFVKVERCSYRDLGSIPENDTFDIKLEKNND